VGGMFPGMGPVPMGGGGNVFVGPGGGAQVLIRQ